MNNPNKTRIHNLCFGCGTERVWDIFDLSYIFSKDYDDNFTELMEQLICEWMVEG